MKEFWNERYSGADYVYGKTPNAFFRNFIDSEPVGQLLLPAEGEGRNAVYAAQKGWEVHALDFSEAARKKAISLAGNNHVRIQYDVIDLSFWKGNGQADAVACIYAHFGPENRSPIHMKFAEALKPGGKFVLEAFSKKQLEFNSGGPKNYEWLYSMKMLEEDFRILNILSLDERIITLDEGGLHSGEAGIIQMIAQKTN
jgi:hypothetical protein